MSNTSCKHPLKAWKIGINPDTGKDKLKITGYDIDFVKYDRFTNGDHAIGVKGKVLPTDIFSGIIVRDFIEIPCGKCISCRLKYSKDWANRMMLEAKEHEHNWFLTLTYDPEHLPDCNEYLDFDTGCFEKSPIHPLVLSDLQKFMKRLRKKFNNQKIRFYACGEYGSENMRPHYHLILFGLDIPDVVPYGRSVHGYQYYVSDIIEKIWNKGLIKLAPTTWETCAYTARYVTKKLNGTESEIYNKYNFPREFATMSRRPGIARNYYDLNKKEIYQNDEMFLSFDNKPGIKIKPPKYYDKLFDIDYPEEMSIIKEKRKEIAEANSKYKMNLTSLDYLSQLEVEEEKILSSTKALKRSL